MPRATAPVALDAKKPVSSRLPTDAASATECRLLARLLTPQCDQLRFGELAVERLRLARAKAHGADECDHAAIGVCEGDGVGAQHAYRHALESEVRQERSERISDGRRDACDATGS